MKKKLLPFVSALMIFGITSCDVTKNSEVSKPASESTLVSEGSATSVTSAASENTEVSIDPATANVAITNKDVMTEDWYVNAVKTLVVSLTPAANPLLALQSGDLVVSADDESAFQITGFGLKAVKAGTFTIKVSYYGHEDTVTVTVTAPLPEPDPVETTVSNLLDNWDTLVATEKSTKFIIEGYITGWASGKTDGQKYGNMFIGDSVDATKTIYIYGCSQNIVITWDGTVPGYSYVQGDDAKDWLTSDMTKNAVIGGKIKVECIAYTYSTTKEISCKLLSYEAPAVVDPETISLPKTAINLEVGQEFELKPTLGPVGAVGEVEYVSSDATVASVTGGKVTALKAGTTTITASVKDHTAVVPAELTVNVSNVDNSVVEAETPAVGTAYKLGIKQMNKFVDTGDAYYFFNGKMDGYYLGATSSMTESPDVKVELKEGSSDEYYLYFMDGETKTYIEQYVSGTYYNVKLSTSTPATTYKWNAKFKTLVTSFDSLDKAIGTSNSSSYATTGPRTIKDDSNDTFFAHLYTADPAATLSAIKCADVTIEAGKKVTLAPAASPAGASLSGLTFSAGEGNTICSVDANGVVTGLEAGETTVTISVGDVTKTVKVTVTVDTTNYGTVEAPLTVAQALALAQEQCANNGDYTRKAVTVKGTMVAADGHFNNGLTGGNEYVGKYNIANGDTVIYVNNSKAGEFKGKVIAGDEVIVTGYITKDATVGLEFLKYGDPSVYPQIAGFGERGDATLAVDPSSSDKATVQIAKTSGKNGEEATFTVTPAEGYSIASVKINDVVIEDTEGTYTVSLLGDMKIVVEAIDNTTSKVEFKNTHDVFGTTTSTAEATYTVNGIGLKTDGVKTGSADSADKNYGYFMIKGGYIASTTAMDGYYIKNVTVTFTSGTGTKGYIDIELTADVNADKSTAAQANCTQVSKGGSVSKDNTDTSLKYFCITNIISENAQIALIEVTYAQIPA